MDYQKYLAYKRVWMNEKIIKDCLTWAIVMIDKYPYLEDWHRVHFTDEVYFRLCYYVHTYHRISEF